MAFLCCGAVAELGNLPWAARDGNQKRLCHSPALQVHFSGVRLVQTHSQQQPTRCRCEKYLVVKKRSRATFSNWTRKLKNLLQDRVTSDRPEKKNQNAQGTTVYVDLSSRSKPKPKCFLSSWQPKIQDWWNIPFWTTQKKVFFSALVILQKTLLEFWGFFGGGCCLVFGGG